MCAFYDPGKPGCAHAPGRSGWPRRRREQQPSPGRQRRPRGQRSSQLPARYVRHFTIPAVRISDTLQVLGCVDSRVDPSHVLGLELGEGVVMRNIGGRITPATLRSWALLGRLGQPQPQGQPQRSGHLVILHHTDCGIIRLMDYREQLAAFFEIPPDELETKAVANPYAAVRVDTAIARRTLPPSRLVSGLVYDVSTGLIEIVDPAQKPR